MNTEGHFFLLEAILVALLILGAIAFVTTLRLPTRSTPRIDSHLEEIGKDALAVLRGLPAEDIYGRSFLTKAITEALHGEPFNLTSKLGGYLPPGTRYAVFLETRRGFISVWENGTPTKGSVTSIVPYRSVWSVAHLWPDFETYDGSSMVMNVTALEIYEGGPVLYRPERPNPYVKVGNATFSLSQRSSVPGIFFGRIPPGEGGYPPRGVGSVESDPSHPTGGIVLPGLSTFRVIPDPYLTSTASSSSEGISASRLQILGWNETKGALEPSRVFTEGSNVTLTWDFTPYVRVHEGHWAWGSVNTTRVTILSPVTPLRGKPLPYLTFETRGISGSWTFEVRKGSYLGPYFVVVELRHTLQGSGGPIDQKARIFDRFDVALPDGIVPLSPIYRVVLQTWLGEWS